MVDPQPPPPSGTLRLAKLALRDQLLTARRHRPPREIVELAASCAEHVLAAPEVVRAATVTAYVAVGSEPGTSVLLNALLRAGKRVLLPVVLPDLDLDWAPYSGVGNLYPGPRGLLEPTADRLGPDAVAHADALLVPGLAVDASGVRLGQGGGCYDRALARVPRGTFTCVLLHPDELDRPVPVEAHDLPVRAAATAHGVRRF